MDENISECIDTIEALHQQVKRDYLEKYKHCVDRGIGSKNNCLTLKFLRKHLSNDIQQKINVETKEIFQYLKTNSDMQENYLIIRELYCIHPSFHETWFVNSHYNKFKEIVSGRLGLKSYKTSVSRGKIGKRINGVTTYILKQAIMLENIYSGKIKRSLIEFEVPETFDTISNRLVNTQIIPSDFESMENCLQDIFMVTKWLINETKYRNLFSEVMINRNNWFFYAPCSINEGPIFYKKSKLSRVEIFSKINPLDEPTARNILHKNYDIEEIMQ